MKTSNIYEILESEGIYGPGSEELKKHEEHLTRYFEREYRRLKENPSTLEEIGVSASEGEIMEETDALMSEHYDERPEFFSSFLDKKYMAYSMAYYGESPEEIRNSNASLEDAQTAKFDLIAERAQIKGDEEILNIGCGFGSLEKYLLKKFPGITITSITASSVQAEYLNNLKSSNNINNGPFERAEIVHASANKILTEFSGRRKFDLVISIGVLEHAKNLQDLISKVSALLNPNGRTFHHFITSSTTIPNFLTPGKTKIGLYFPGGRIWPFEELPKHHHDLDITSSWFVNGLNYHKTLNQWHIRFWEKLPMLHNNIFNIENINHWNKYFSLCKAVFYPFEGRDYGNGQFLFTKL